MAVKEGKMAVKEGVREKVNKYLRKDLKVGKVDGPASDQSGMHSVF